MRIKTPVDCARPRVNDSNQMKHLSWPNQWFLCRCDFSPSLLFLIVRVRLGWSPLLHGPFTPGVKIPFYTGAALLHGGRPYCTTVGPIAPKSALLHRSRPYCTTFPITPCSLLHHGAPGSMIFLVLSAKFVCRFATIYIFLTWKLWRDAFFQARFRFRAWKFRTSKIADYDCRDI